MGYVLEHRLVMESSLKRILKATEVVHHLDGDRLNNEISNLSVCASAGKHSAEHHIKRGNHGRFSK